MIHSAILYDHLVIDGSRNMWVNSHCTVIAAWLNASQRSQVGLETNRSARGWSVKPGLHSVRRTYATEMRKRIYASHARRGVYTPRVDLGAIRDIYAISVAYHFREMDLFYMSRKSLGIRIGYGLLTNDNPASTRKRRRIVGVFTLGTWSIPTA